MKGLLDIIIQSNNRNKIFMQLMQLIYYGNRGGDNNLVKKYAQRLPKNRIKVVKVKTDNSDPDHLHIRDIRIMPHDNILKYYYAKFSGSSKIKDKVAIHLARFYELNERIYAALGKIDGFDQDPAYYFISQPNLDEHLKIYDKHHFASSCSLPCTLYRQWSSPKPIYILDMPIWKLICNILSGKVNPQMMTSFIITNLKLLMDLDFALRDIIKSIDITLSLDMFNNSCSFILAYIMCESDFNFEFCSPFFKSGLFYSSIIDACCKVADTKCCHNNVVAHKLLNLILSCDCDTGTPILKFIFGYRNDVLIDALLNRNFSKYLSLEESYRKIVHGSGARHQYTKRYIILGLTLNNFERELAAMIRYTDENCNETFLDMIFKYSPHRFDSNAIKGLLSVLIRTCMCTRTCARTCAHAWTRKCECISVCTCKTFFKYFKDEFFEYISADEVYKCFEHANIDEALKCWRTNICTSLTMLDYLFEHDLQANYENLSIVLPHINKQTLKAFMEFGFDIASELEHDRCNAASRTMIEEILSEESMSTKSARKN